METISKIPISEAQRKIEEPAQVIEPPVPHGNSSIDENVLACI
jgi:hypothetical protein